MTYPQNQFAPEYFQGLQQGQDVGYEPRPYTYLYNPPNNQLTAAQLLQGQAVAIDVDSDFLLMGWYISLFTGVFQIQLIDSSGYQLMSGFLNSGAVSQSSADPTVFSPEHPFPAGGKIQINIQDLSDATNPLQIAFVGKKLFRVKRSVQ